MAFNNSRLDQSVFGNKRVEVYSCVADAAEGTIVTGLQFIDSVTYAPRSMTTAAGKLKPNKLTSGTAAAGTLAISGIATGDELYVTVYGR